MALAVACKASPSPPPLSESESESVSARAAVSSAPAAPASVASVTPPRCADWTVSDHRATGSLERWCQQFTGCPENLQQAVSRGPHFLSRVEARGNHRIVRSGFMGGRKYTFERDRLVGAEIWDDVPFGACQERGIVTYTAGVALPPEQNATSCGVVPGRDYTNGEPCRCNSKARQPTLRNGNQGPLLRTSLECLYEVGVAAHLCQPTLQAEREFIALKEKDAKMHAELAEQMRRSRGSAPPTNAEKTSRAQAAFRSSERTECGGTLVSSTYEGAPVACRYAAAGTLTGLRWGKRYESEGFAACKP